MGAFVPAEGLGETITVAELTQELLKHPGDSLVIIRLCLAKGEPTPDGGIIMTTSDPLDCGLDIEDIEPGSGVIYLCTGHEAIEEALLP